MEDEDEEEECLRKDLLVLHLPQLLFIILEFDPETCEFATHSLYNYDHMEELKQSGKRYPLQGMLRAVSIPTFTGFTFIADDTIFCWVEL